MKLQQCWPRCITHHYKVPRHRRAGANQAPMWKRGPRVGVLPSKENLKRLRLLLLDMRKLRGNMTEMYKIRKAVNKNCSFPNLTVLEIGCTWWNQREIGLEHVEEWFYIIWVVNFLVLLEVVKMQFSSFQKGLDKFREKQTLKEHINRVILGTRETDCRKLPDPCSPRK